MSGFETVEVLADFKPLAYGHEYIEILRFWTNMYKSVGEDRFRGRLETLLTKLTSELDTYVEKDDGSLPFHQVLKEMVGPIKVLIDALKTKENTDVDDEAEELGKVLRKYREALYEAGLMTRFKSEWPLTEEDKEEERLRSERFVAKRKEQDREREERGYG